MSINIEKAEIVEKWFVAIIGASGESDKLKKDFIERVQGAGVPAITVNTARLGVGVAGAVKGFLKGRAAQAHEFVEITDDTLPGYVIYAGSRDYGKLLIASWYLVADEHKLPTLGRALAGGIAANLLKLNMFETEELSAFASVAHEALKDAVEQIMTAKGLDFSKVDTKSRGFLNIS